MSEIQKIGIVGDGQLGRMLAEAALPMGYDVTALGTAGPNSPAAQVGAKQIEGSLTDAGAIRQLAERTNVVTWEIEHIDTESLQELANEGYNIQPSPDSLSTIKDKLHQKDYFRRLGLSVAPYRQLEYQNDLDQAWQDFGGQVILKTRLGGYDGRGNLVMPGLRTLLDIKKDFNPGSPYLTGLYAEQIIPFQRELSLVGARDLTGRIATYPVVETVHENNICHMVFAPAEIDPRVAGAAEDLGRAAIESFDGAGVFAVEMFQDEEDNVIINEVAPRVHNSGHYSIEGARTSQFENHIRAITGMRLGPTDMTAPAAVMINVLGTRTSDVVPSFEVAQIAPNVYVHGYGKTPRNTRKIGHVTVLADSLKEAKTLALAARAKVDV